MMNLRPFLRIEYFQNQIENKYLRGYHIMSIILILYIFIFQYSYSIIHALPMGDHFVYDDYGEVILFDVKNPKFDDITPLMPKNPPNLHKVVRSCAVKKSKTRVKATKVLKDPLAESYADMKRLLGMSVSKSDVDALCETLLKLDGHLFTLKRRWLDILSPEKRNSFPNKFPKDILLTKLKNLLKFETISELDLLHLLNAALENSLVK
jgi:hypothetical protein